MDYSSFRPWALLLFVTLAYPMQSQVVASNPWSIADPNLMLENSHLTIISNKVVYARSFTCRSEKQVGDMRHLHYEVQFDSAGYPVTFKNGEAFRAGAKVKSHADARFGRKWIAAVEFHFEYNPDHQLHRMVVFRWDNEFSRYEEEVRYTYDTDRRLIEQHHSDRTIYRRGYTYRGTSYPNDTIVTEYSVDYLKDTQATYVVHQEGSVISDMLVVEVADSMPSTFDGIMERPVPSGHAKIIGGECVPLYSANPERIRYTYEGGILRFAELISADNQVRSRTGFEFGDSGLLDRVLHSDGIDSRWMQYVFAD